VVAVVTRWFGGTLLGTGGLIRAYGDAVSQAADAAGVRQRRLVQRVAVEVSHGEAGRLENDLRARGFAVEVEYAAAATITLDVTVDQRAGLDQLIAHLTGGGGQVVDRDRRWADAPS
jgi:putative IMPACT (imprinted ancient) family translation regulator